MKKILFTALLFFIPALSWAFQPLPVEKVFQLSVTPSSKNTLVAQWKIAPGYHLYRDRIHFNVLSPSNIHLGAIDLPQGIDKQDNILGKYQIYENAVTAPIPLVGTAPKKMVLVVAYQGCADSGFCYPPITKEVTLSLNNVPTDAMHAAISADPAVGASASAAAASVDNTAVANSGTSATPQDKATQLLAHQNIFFILMGFFGFGLLLAFTPCVLPMIPILSGIIVGESNEINALKAFWLSLTYVLAMAITYACAGVIAGLAGGYVQAFLQNPWVLASFSGIFVLLALSLFGFFELRMPDFLHHRVTELSNRHSGGDYVGVAAMGCLSTLILSPCVTAPLIGALSYIGKTGNALLGGSALFTMGLGMGIPLIIIGTVGGKFLPKAGAWMDLVKAVFGVMMLGVALLLLSRILPEQIIMMAWATLLIVSAVYMGAFTATPQNGFGKLWKGFSIILLVYGFLLLIGACMGNTDALQPLAMKQAVPVSNITQAEPFKIVSTVEELQQALDDAKAQSKPVMIDYYADWCVSCKELDVTTFKNPQVQDLLSKFVLLRVDVTDNNAATKELQKKFGVIAPPTMVFFNASGEELPLAQIVGAMGAKDFIQRLHQVLG